MQDLLELQTGQVAFLSGLLAGFSLTVAANILQVESSRAVRTVCLVLLLLATLLFLIALYVDVRLTIELASLDDVSDEASKIIHKTRAIGTTSATLAVCFFVAAIGMLGWLAGTMAGILSTLLAIITFLVLGYVWWQVSFLA